MNAYSKVFTTLFYFLSACITCFLVLAIFHKYGFQLTTPLYYNHDSLPAATFIKTFIDSGLAFSNPNLGAPLNADFSDYPLSDSATMIILKLISLINGNFAITFNIFLILTFPLTTIVSLFVFQNLGLHRPFALAASILFTFLPFHFFRMELGHIFLSTLYIVPIYVFFIFTILKQKNFLAAKNNIPVFFLYSLICFFAASSGIYYAFFACFFLFVAAFIAYYENKNLISLANAGLLVFLISLTVFINISPAILTKIEQGKNNEVGQRQPGESEYYGLKITQLLLPADHHRSNRLARFKDHYNSTSPITNGENTTASLGIIASLGFIFLIFILLFKEVKGTLFYLSRLNIAALLLSTVGGAGALFAYIVTPEIRCYDRISLFIAFFSLTTIFLILQKVVHFYPDSSKKRLSILIAILAILIGLIDQIPRVSFSADKLAFENDRKFIARIESTMPAGAMIMQLPYIDFPESPDIEQMDSYNLFKAYLHSHYLHWSFGSMRGRKAAHWQKKITQQSTKKMLDNLAYANFSGLYIDRRGYPHRAKAIEAEITQLTHSKPIVDDLHTLSFYDLRPYTNRLHASMSENKWKNHVSKEFAAINSPNHAEYAATPSNAKQA